MKKRIWIILLAAVLLLTGCADAAGFTPETGGSRLTVENTTLVESGQISLRIPDGWEYETSGVDTMYEDIGCVYSDLLSFWPAGQDKNTVCVKYTPALPSSRDAEGFDTFTLGGYDAWAESLDGGKWSYIHLLGTDASCEIYIRYADVWWNEYGDAAMEILDTITITDHSALVESGPISLRIPDGWEYEFGTDRLCYGYTADTILSGLITFWPAGQEVGTVSVWYSPVALGFCGTGNFDHFTLGGYEAWAERYDGEKVWNYIHLMVPVGDCEIHIKDADCWWDEYGDAAMEILDTLVISENGSAID